MKKWLFFLSIFILLISLLYDSSLKDKKNEIPSSSSQQKINVLLDIPPRLQWQNNSGYCGACSIQQIAAYYGSYVSQYICRKIVNPSQKIEVLIGLNENKVLNALSFTYEQWNWRKRKKWKKYLVWTKQHLYKGVPVIITAYIKGMNDPDYDHIMPAVGVNSSNRNKYNNHDELIFNDNFVLQHRMRTFSSLPDRSYTYALPTRYNYGCAVTGIQDDEGITLPVYLSIDSWDEPNVTKGKSPASLSGKVQISSLTPGKSYLLLRYDDYKDVPSKNFHDSNFSSSTSFIATKETQSFNVQFISDGVAMFRCIPEKRYSIAGKVSTRKAKGKFLARPGLRGVVMQGLPGNPSTDASGRYRAYIDPGWSGTVTPFKANYKFNPSSRDYSNVNVDQRNQNYTASRAQNTLTIQTGTKGSPDPSPGVYEYGHDTNVSITTVPDGPVTKKCQKNRRISRIQNFPFKLLNHL